MYNTNSIDSWGVGFGILPIPLTTSNDGQYIFQSGLNNDTCMRIGGELDPKDGFETAWSVGALNYLHTSMYRLYVYNWDMQSKREFDVKRVENDLLGFIQYINRNSYRSEANVLDFILDMFRKMRNLTPKDADATVAIDLLCRLLVSLQESDYRNLDAQWGIKSEYIPYAFDTFVDQIRYGVKGMRPQLDLILRHCAGAIFEVANQEVTNFYPQRDLFGGVSSKLQLQRIPYASMHYTPLYLARGIVENVLKKVDLSREKLTIIDPACGSGVFLSEMLKQLRLANYNNEVYIKAYDKSGVAIQTTRFLLEYEKRTQWGDNLHLDIQCIDSLENDWGVNDVVVMNPPFISWDLMDVVSERPIVHEMLKDIVSGKPNMACAFVYKAMKSLAPNGVVGAVVPSSILTADNYQNLREWLLKNNELSHVASLGSFVFESAVTDTSFLILQNHSQALEEDRIPLAIWCRNEKDVAPKAMSALHTMQVDGSPAEVTRQYSIYHPKRFPILLDTWQVISAQEEKFVNELNQYMEWGRLSPMGEVLRINQGVVTGLRDVFEVSDVYYNHLTKAERKYFRPMIDHDAYFDNYIQTSKYLWYPYDDNGLMISSEEEAMSCSFIRDHLINFKDMLLRRKGVTHWWELTRPRSNLMKKEVRMYSARFGNNNLFGIDTKGDAVSVEGNYYCLKASMYKDDLYFYLAICSSNIFKYLLSIYAKRIRAGYDLSPKQVASLPVPDVEKLRDDILYTRLVELGVMIANGTRYDVTGLNELVSYFYPKRDGIY